MSLEDRLRETLRRAVEREPIVRARQWEIVEGRGRRLAWGRYAAVAASAAVLAAGLAVALPRLGGGENPALLGSPGESLPTAGGTGGPTREPGGTGGWVRFTDASVGYRLLHPPAWSVHREDAAGRTGFVAFVSPSDPPAAAPSFEEAGAHDFSYHREGLPPCDRCPVAVTVFLQDTLEHRTYLREARAAVARWAGQGAETSEQAVGVAGRSATAFGIAFPDRDPGVEPWCRGCRGDWFLVPWLGGTTLDVRVMAPDAAAYERDGGTALRVVAGIEAIEADGPVALRPDPTAAPPWLAPDYSPKHGGPGTEMPHDMATFTALRLMDARVDGQGAERYLSPEAAERFERGEGGLSLYSPTSNPHYARFELVERSGEAGERASFIVRIDEEYTGRGIVSSFEERIEIAPGRNVAGEEGWVVVFAERLSGASPATATSGSS